MIIDWNITEFKKIQYVTAFLISQPNNLYNNRHIYHNIFIIITKIRLNIKHEALFWSISVRYYIPNKRNYILNCVKIYVCVFF